VLALVWAMVCRAMLYDGVRWCAVQCGAVRCGAVRCGAVRCGAVRCGAVLCYAVLCCAVLCCTLICCTPLDSTLLLCCAVACSDSKLTHLLKDNFGANCKLLMFVCVSEDGLDVAETLYVGSAWRVRACVVACQPSRRRGCCGDELRLVAPQMLAEVCDAVYGGVKQAAGRRSDDGAVSTETRAGGCQGGDSRVEAGSGGSQWSQVAPECRCGNAD
jgi:hypothetical protein